MNEELLLTVADAIATLRWGQRPGGFTMGYFSHDGRPACQSPACIAGWTCFIVDGHVPQQAGLGSHPAHDRAMELLGLDDQTADRLFAPNMPAAYWDAAPHHRRFIGPGRAAATLRHLAETGRVDWAITERQPDHSSNL